jgi:hypothetical protein
MPTVFASPGLKWEGFGPQAYVLANEKVWDLPLRNDLTGESTTVGKVVSVFRDQKVEVGTPVLNLKIKSEAQEIVVSGPQVHLELLALQYWLAEQEVSPFEVRWYYFDKDYCLKDVRQHYSFFLVAKEKIIKENFSLSDWPGSGFDPSLLISTLDDDQTWAAEDSWSAAHDRFWYRKFYSETRTGQLMTLRPDKPQLYHEPNESAIGVERWMAEINRDLVGVRFAIWVLVALSLLSLYLRFS